MSRLTYCPVLPLISSAALGVKGPKGQTFAYVSMISKALRVRAAQNAGRLVGAPKVRGSAPGGGKGGAGSSDTLTDGGGADLGPTRGKRARLAAKVE